MFRITADVGGAVQALDLFSSAIEDVDGLLRDFSKVKRAEVDARFRNQGPGWAPLAPATLERREQRLAARDTAVATRAVVKMRQKLNREYRRALGGGDATTIARRLAVKAEFERIVSGGSLSYSLVGPVTTQERAVARARAKITCEIAVAKKAKNDLRVLGLQQQLDRFDRQHEGEVTALADKRLAKSLTKLPERIARSQQRYGDRVLGAIAGSIVARVRNAQLVIESKIEWAGVHNEGGRAGHGAEIKERTFLEWTTDDFEELVAMAQDRALAAFEGA